MIFLQTSGLPQEQTHPTEPHLARGVGGGNLASTSLPASCTLLHVLLGWVLKKPRMDTGVVRHGREHAS